MVVSDINNGMQEFRIDGLPPGQRNSSRLGYAGIKIPEIKDSFKKEITAKNDGKFSFWEFGKNIIKGTGQFFADIYKNVIEHPVISAGFIAAGAAAASTPLGLMLLSAGGLLAATFGAAFVAVKSAGLINDGKWDKLEKQGEEFGKLIPATIISVLGVLRSSKMLADTSAKWAQLTSSVSKSAKSATSAEISATKFWPAIKKAIRADDLAASLVYRIIKVPFRAIKKPFLSKENRANYKIFTLKNNAGKSIYETFSEKLKTSKFFTDTEKKYLASYMDKSDPNRARIFDWTFKGLRDLRNFIPAAKQASE